MIAPGRRSKCFRTAPRIASSETAPVPNVSTLIEVGCATPIA